MKRSMIRSARSLKGLRGFRPCLSWVPIHAQESGAASKYPDDRTSSVVMSGVSLSKDRINALQARLGPQVRCCHAKFRLTLHLRNKEI